MKVKIGDFIEVNNGSSSHKVQAVQISPMLGKLISAEGPTIGNRYDDTTYAVFKDSGGLFINIKDELIQRKKNGRSPVFFRFIHHPTSPNYGACFAIRINYTEKRIEYGYSICKGDRFDRVVGKRMALSHFVSHMKAVEFSTKENLVVLIKMYPTINIIAKHLYDTNKQNYNLITSIWEGDVK